MDVKQAFEYAYETLSKPLLRDIDKTSDRQESVIIFLIKGLEAEVSHATIFFGWYCRMETYLAGRIFLYKNYFLQQVRIKFV